MAATVMGLCAALTSVASQASANEASPAPAVPAPAAPAAAAPVVVAAPTAAASPITATLGGLFVVRGALAAHDGALQDGFQVRMARPQLRGQLLRPWLTFFVQPELAGANPRLLDAQLVAQPIPEVGVTIGQFLTPFSRTFLTPVPKLLFPDFSVANDFFRADRDTGVQVQGTFAGERVGYAAGVFNGNGIDKTGISAVSGGNDDNRLAAIGRVHVDPLGAIPLDEAPCQDGRCPLRVSLGAGFVRSETTVAATGTTPVVRKGGTDLGLDAVVIWQRLHLQTEWYERWVNSGPQAGQHARGGYAHLGLTVVPQRLGVAARYSLVRADDRTTKQDVSVAEVQLVGYALGHRAKGWLRAAHRTDASHKDDALTLQLQWAL